jgi:hypothetical protein
VPPEFELFDHIGPLAGNVAMGFVRVVRARSRDTVVAMYQDSFEGEPIDAHFWVLDSPSDTVMRYHGWAVQFTDDEKKIVYSRSDCVYTAPDADMTAQYADQTTAPPDPAALMPPEAARASYEDGFAGNRYTVHLSTLDLTTGKERHRLLPGGGVLERFDGHIIGLPRPAHYEFPTWKPRDPGFPRRLDLKRGRWVPLAPGRREKALAFLEEIPLSRESCDIPHPIRVGDVVLTSRDRRLGLVIVDTSKGGTVRGARLPESWNGASLCPPR